MAFQVGNPGAGLRQQANQKLFHAALLTEINSTDDRLALRLVARKLISVAQKGNVAAIKEIADRIDGKVPQALVADEGGPIVLQVVRYVVQEGAQVIDITPDTPTGTDLTVTGQAVLDVNASPSKPIETMD